MDINKEMVIISPERFAGMARKIEEYANRIDQEGERYNVLRDAVYEAIHDDIKKEYEYFGHPSFTIAERWGKLIKLTGYQFPESEAKELAEKFQAEHDQKKKDEEETK